jgi:ABC-type transport system involved in multi-copper enzyme maturation permease subunit
MTITAATAPRGWSLPRLRGLTWITWRQHRFALLGVATLLGGFALLMIIHGAAMHGDYHRLGLNSCGSITGDNCQAPIAIFQHRYQSIADFLPVLLTFAPALIGAFVGAPLVARELETGTFRFAWTQATDRARWTIVKLTLLGVVLAGLALAFSALYGWWFEPWEPLLGRIQSGKSYEVEGVVFAARTVFAFTLGALLGAVIRRTLTAMAATLAVWVGVVFSSAIYVRPHIQAPVVAPDSSRKFVRTDWTISNWTQDASGHHLSTAQLDALTQQAQAEALRSADPRLAFDQWFIQRGYSTWSKYQPNLRFWHFQLIEGSAYLLLTLMLAAATVWWVRRRAA